jgi:hypothetical protein
MKILQVTLVRKIRTNTLLGWRVSMRQHDVFLVWAPFAHRNSFARGNVCLESVSLLHGHGCGTLDTTPPREVMAIAMFLYKEYEKFSRYILRKNTPFTFP